MKQDSKMDIFCVWPK